MKTASISGLCCLGFAIIFLLIAGAALFFLIRGQVQTADDGRVSILLAPEERNLVLGEMRGFLEAVQAMTESMSAGDMKTAAEAARKVGRVDLKDLPPSLVLKLPAEVKALGLDTHRAFAQLARDIDNGLSKEKAFARLGEILNNCTTCHAGYRLDPQIRGQ